MCRKWKKEEKEMLRQNIENGIPLQAIKIANRNYDRIRRQARKLKLIAPLKNPSLTDEQKAELCRLRRQGFSAEQIADFDMLGKPERTAVAIQKSCMKLGLVQKNRSRAAKKRKIWAKGEKKKFCDFLLCHSSKLASKQIAKLFGVKRGTVELWQRQLGVKPCLQDTLALPYVKRKLKRAYRKKSQKMLASFEEHILSKQEKLKNLAEIIRGKKWIVQKQCQTCRKFWPKHKSFFFHSTVRKNKHTSWYFCSPCKLCVARQRHEKKLRHHQKYS